MEKNVFFQFSGNLSSLKTVNRGVLGYLVSFSRKIDQYWNAQAIVNES